WSARVCSSHLWFNQKYVPTEVGREQRPRSSTPVVPSKPDAKDKAAPEKQEPATDQKEILPEETVPSDPGTEIDTNGEINDVPPADGSQPSVENKQEPPSEPETQKEAPENKPSETIHTETPDQPKN
ncbi:carboxypeptidase, partial [Paenibacillus sp. 28ISP30-2]|nr:carboxypeptidase [Paenibacillus sp. 28ISP30-2]